MRATSGSPASAIERGRSLLDSFAALHWLPEVGIGYYPVTANPYNEAYWEKYRGLDETAIGDALASCRLSLVRHYWGGRVVDVGIGGGRFLKEYHDAVGFDINETAVDWLKLHGRWHDPYKEPVDAACFWDSLEHIHDPAPLLANIRRWCFVSLPIFRDATHVLQSKHFKPDEHVWYFTRSGFVHFMARFKFRMIERSSVEQLAGREDVETFAFRREE